MATILENEGMQGYRYFKVSHNHLGLKHTKTVLIMVPPGYKPGYKLGRGLCFKACLAILVLGDRGS